MFKTLLFGVGLLCSGALSGCVVYSPAPYRAVVYDPEPAVVVAPVFPVFGFYGGYYHGYHGGYHRWR